MENTFKLEASSPAASRHYVLLVSGTMNPPHQGHVRLGLRAADALRAEGHTVSAVCFVPVHNNYMHNKAATQGSGPLFYPMERRCAMLKALVTAEGTAAADLCHVIDHEGEHSEELLEESPGYWAPKLPAGYLRTVPTVRLIHHFARTSPHLQAAGVRLGLVFGVDNLVGMASWNPNPNPNPKPKPIPGPNPNPNPYPYPTQGGHGVVEPAARATSELRPRAARARRRGHLLRP
jgi:nicotinic acid mononucleotide adenylyltransferase